MNKAVFVAAGILVSRVAGFIRLRAFAHYFGLQSDAADAFNAAFRIPNFLQNLFGEGALSASFIPVYASMVSQGGTERRDADRVAGAVGAFLALVVSVLVLVGVLVTPWLIAIIAPGFTGDKRALTIELVRILFPGAGCLALSAWCLGILNSHHRFLLSYAAPVIWNAAMIATLLIFGASSTLPQLAVALAWGSVAGSLLQFAIQLPVVLLVAPSLRASLDLTSHHVRMVFRNFVPVFISRGVVQISAYIDALLASLLPTGAVTGLANAQLLYTLPVSLFGMSIAAAELPAMSGEARLRAPAASDATAEAPRNDALRQRLDTALQRVAFFVIPSAMAFLALGDVIAAAVLQTGRFRYADAVYVWGILAGSAIGLLASTMGRLYSSTYYALRDTRTPLRFALVRVVLTTILGYLFAIPVPRWFGLPAHWGAAGLSASAGLAGWVELSLLRRSMNDRIGSTGLRSPYVVRLWTAAAIGAAAAWLIKLRTPPSWHPIVTGAIILGPYVLVFASVAAILGIRNSILRFGRSRV